LWERITIFLVSFSAFVPESFESVFAQAGLLTCFCFRRLPILYWNSGKKPKTTLKLTAAGTVQDFHLIPSSPEKKFSGTVAMQKYEIFY